LRGYAVIIFNMSENKSETGLSEELAACRREARELSGLFQALELINSTLDYHKVLDCLMELATEVTGSEAASAILIENGQLSFVAASGTKSIEIKRVHLGRKEGVAGWVVENKSPLLIPDVSKDLRFTKKADSTSGFNTRSLVAVPLKIEEEIIGVLEAVNKKSGVFSESDIKVLSILANSAAVAIHKARLYADLNELFLSTVKSIANAIEAKDSYLHGHSERIRDFAMMIARGLGLSKEEEKNVELTAIFHDVGKIGVDDKILRKKEKLSDSEFQEIRKHPAKGAEILSSIKQLKNIIPGILYHQEHFDGRGYPEGISGKSIPLTARIIAVADAFDAMTSDRSYRTAISVKDAIKELEKCSGTQFDPVCVKAFIDNFEPRNAGGDKK